VSGLNRVHEFLHSNSSWMRAKHNAEFHYALGRSSTALARRSADALHLRVLGEA
jgi:hypothetical protein